MLIVYNSASFRGICVSYGIISFFEEEHDVLLFYLPQRLVECLAPTRNSENVGRKAGWKDRGMEDGKEEQENAGKSRRKEGPFEETGNEPSIVATALV